jgi:hypothetical protein
MPAEYVPTDAERSLVESAAAFGLTQADIAEQLKIDASARWSAVGTYSAGISRSVSLN